MKIKRQKKVNRVLNFFKHNFGHRPPYQMLLDGTFCQACLTAKVNIKDQLPKYLGEVKLLTTKCCIQEIEKLGSDLFGATVILKQFAVHKCDCAAPVPAAKCIKSMLKDNNPNRYFVATQDPELRVAVRKVPGTPVMYLHHSAPVLERPSEMSSATASEVVRERVAGPDFQTKILAALKKKEFGEDPDADAAKRKRKRKKGGPNPLSCLKKKPTAKKNGVGEAKSDKDLHRTTKDTLVTAGKKRKRRSKKPKTDA